MKRDAALLSSGLFFGAAEASLAFAPTSPSAESSVFSAMVFFILGAFLLLSVRRHDKRAPTKKA